MQDVTKPYYSQGSITPTHYERNENDAHVYPHKCRQKCVCMHTCVCRFPGKTCALILYRKQMDIL